MSIRTLAGDCTVRFDGRRDRTVRGRVLVVVKPDDTVLVPSNGYFGDLMAEMARRAGGIRERVDARGVSRSRPLYWLAVPTTTPTSSASPTLRPPPSFASRR